MSVSPFKSVTQLRATLEAFAARQAALRVAAGAAPETLLLRFAQLGKAAHAGRARRFAEADRAVHQAVIELADVPGLLPAWQAAFAAQDEFRRQTLRRCWPDLSVLFESHRPLVDHVAAGQAAEAEQAAQAHLDAVWYRLAEAANDESLPRDALSRATAYVAFHYAQPLRLPRLAAEVAGCSAGHLARLFRDKLGLSFSEYLIELRLQKAADLLRHGATPVARIARPVGYADASRFATHFRRRFGCTPKAFRQQFARNHGEC